MFEPLDPQLARELIAKETDLLSKAAEEDAKRYADLRCPMCYQSGCVKELIPTRLEMSENGPIPVSTPFGSSLVPEGYAVCLHCETKFDPKTGIILHSGPTIVSSQ